MDANQFARGYSSISSLTAISFSNMALNEFVRDNLDAFSFNMIIICILNIVVFLILFIMTMPLPDVMKRGYANVLLLLSFQSSLSSLMLFPSCSS